MQKSSGFAKILIIIFLTLSISGSVFLFPQNADAQGVTLRLPEIAHNIWKSVSSVAQKIYDNTAATAFKTALSQFLNKMAYDMATAVATGAPGQKSLIFDDPKYFINLGDAVMGNAVDEIAQGSGFTNMLGTTSLCQPADLTTKVNLLLSFKKPAEPLKPKCSLSLMKKSLAESANSFTNSFSLANLSLRFEMGDLEEARNSLRKALTVEKYLSSGAPIDGKLSEILTDLEKASDDLSGLIRRIYQKPISERQAAADGELKNLSEVQTQLILNQNKISQIQEMINDCGQESGNCLETGAAGVCQIFIANPTQMNCSAAVSAAQTYHDQFQKLETDLTDGMNNLYDGILKKAFTVPDANDPKDIGNAFNPQANPMGQYFLIKEAQDKNVNIKIENEKLLQRIGKGCEPKKDPVSGMNTLPASAACGIFNFAMSKSTVNEETYTGIFSQALSIFTNTLAGKLMQSWFEKGVANLFGKGKGKNSTSASDLASGNLARGKAAAEEKFLTLLQSNFTAGGPFEAIKELTVCPEKGANPNNCAIDSDFSQAISERLTLKEAMDKKLLDPKKPFGYVKTGGILVEPSYLNGYPYRSMIVLRKFRIIPVGWELAAEWIRDPGKNTDKTLYTLKQMVDCYESAPDCIFIKNGKPNPFYHLVDPGWVFLEQPAFCKRQGAGEKILAEEFICSKPDAAKQDGSCLEYSRNVFRQEYCADEQTCLAKNDDGSCRFYGYCSEDAPSWKLDGSSCKQEYNSCQTYGNKDGANVSYLDNSISSGGCNAGNANCQWYCEEAPLACSGGAKNGWLCSDNNDCVNSKGLVDGVCRPTDLWKCQGKNLIDNGGVEIDDSGWTTYIGTGSSNRISTLGHESFASLSSASSSAESGFQSAQFSTKAVCTGGSNDGTACFNNTACLGGGICKNGEVIDASAWVNLSSSVNGAGIRIRALDGGGSEVGRLESERISDLNVWKPVHVSMPISNTTAVNFLLELVSYGSGTTALFDDIGLFRGNRISFDKDVKQCEAKDAGCHEFARTTNGANLIFNPGFEIKEKSFNEAAAASDWYGWYGTSAAGSINRDESAKRSGKASLKVDAGAGSTAVIGAETPDPRSAIEQEYKLMPEDFYTFSVYAKAQTACVGNCLSLVGDCKVGAGGESQQGFKLSTSWERYSFNYKKSKIANDGNECRFFVRLNPSNTYWLDDAKLEIGNQSTNYKDYGSEKIYLNQSRLSCDLSEVGCELYKPANGDAGIPAAAKTSDQCPAECVGYETYHEIPSYFDPVEDAAANVIFPNLIPSTAVQCSAQAAGCEEFTNLDTVASGGEAKEYYTKLRQCAKPGTTTEATYYTWEGSEESGFQLRVWKLKANADGTPFTADGSNTCNLADPDCRVFYAQNGQPYNRPLSKTVFISDDCHPLRRTIEGTQNDCTASGGYLWEDPNGDLSGVCYYNAIPSQGIKCEPKYANCREYKGPSANNQTSLFKYDFEDTTQENDWSLGAQSTESVSVGEHSLEVAVNPYDTKRDISLLVDKAKTYLVKFWAKPATNNPTSVIVQFDDGLSSPKSLINSSVLALMSDWNSYVLGPIDFTARDPGSAEKLIINADESFYIDNIELIEAGDDSFVIKDSWNTPVSCDVNPFGISKNLSTGGPDLNATDINIPLNNTGGLPISGDILIDSEIISYNNIFMTGVSAVRRGERGTAPAIHLNGAKVLFLEPGFALHCSAYADRAKNTHNLKSFSKLCREDHIGCELLADTQNTQSPFGEWKSAEFAPQDRLTPIVNDDKKYCDGKFKGCQKLGRPEVDANNGVTSWNSVYLTNDPDNYKEILCQNSENWCREYKTPDGSEKYFKDPGKKLCEYKEDIGVGNVVISGWFIKGQYDKVNPPECLGAMRHCSIDRNGSFLFCRQPSDCQPIGKNGLPEDLGNCIAKDTEWVKECPETQSSCAEYKDPLFSKTQGVKDRYYYLADMIDEGKCKGQIDEEQKCVAFNNTENPIMNTRASGTCKVDSAIYCSTNADCRRLPPDGTGNPDDVCLMKNDKPFEPQACVRCSTDQVSCDPDPSKPNPCCSVVSAAGKIACDANTILYVQKDRDCREWLSCVSSAKITNAQGEKEEVCYDVARCTRIDPVTGACLKQADDKNYCKGNLFCDSGTRGGRACLTDNDCAPINGPSDGTCQPLVSPKRCSTDSQCMNFEGTCDLTTLHCTQNSAKVCAVNSDCAINQGPCVADNQTFDSPKLADVPPHIGAVDDLRYRSGFNPYGIHWTPMPLPKERNGEYLPTTAMQKGQVILLEDGDFEKQKSAWSRFSNCSTTRTQCVNNTTCLAGDHCDLSANFCAVSHRACPAAVCSISKTACSDVVKNKDCPLGETCSTAFGGDNLCFAADSCGGSCSNNHAIRCRDNKDCGAVGPCDYSSPVCFVSGGACANAITGNPDNSLCSVADVCSEIKDFAYERIKALSGLRALKLGQGESAFQGNYPGATNFNDVKPIFVAGNSQISFSGYINTVDLKGGGINAARVKIQEFKKGATPFDSVDKIVMRQESGKPWSFYAGIFTVGPETESIRILLEVDPGASGSAYFDNFLMLPVLNYQNQSYPIPFLEVYDPENTSRPGLNPFIGRSCRLYPQTNAPACFYTNEQKQQFQGWRGFCLKPDPSNPLQCLQWLPIDQLQGESGLGFKTESSYSGKTPLYYCAEMSLWQLRCNASHEKVWDGNFNQDDCPTDKSIDPSCPSTYSHGNKCLGSKLSCWWSSNKREWCQVVGAPGPLANDRNNDCFWVPYRSCPYGKKDIANGIKPNLIGRCDKLIEVVDAEGQNIAWTNRIDQKLFKMGTPYGYVYDADQNSPLYGSVFVLAQENELPSNWQKTFDKSFITLGGQVRTSTCLSGQTCEFGGQWRCSRTGKDCTADHLNPWHSSLCDPLFWSPDICRPIKQCFDGASYGASCIGEDLTITKSTSGKYPLWVIPKSEDGVAGAGIDACMISFGGSPMSCTSPYCYNNKPTSPPLASLPLSPQCQDPTKKSLALSVAEKTGSAKTSADDRNKKNKENFVQGAKRLQHLFSRSYSTWAWNAGQCLATDSANTCAGTCNISGKPCIDDSYCPAGETCANINQETGNSCDPASEGYRCSGNTQKPCVNESDSVCASNGWGSCELGGFADDCNNPAGKCTPAGGGVCQDAANGIVTETCSSECIGGSCGQYRCGGVSGGAVCDTSDLTACSGVPANCLFANLCKGGPNDGNNCVPSNNCITIPGNSGCPGGGACNFILTPPTCSGGARDGRVCEFTPVCTNKRCADGSGKLGGFCISDSQCNTATSCTDGGGSCNAAGICSSGTSDGRSCSETCQDPAIAGAPPQVCFSGGYNASGDYERLKSCTNNSDCLGTSAYNSCAAFNHRCAIQKDGSGALKGSGKAGTYCNDDLPCRANICDDGGNVGELCAGPADCPGGACVADNGKCAAKWCSDGPLNQLECTINADCLAAGTQAYTYVNIGDVRSVPPNPNFAQTLWTPPSNQCSNPVGFIPINNQRPYAVQPPNKDIILETGEKCGVAPEIRFINKPGDPSVPVDIKIDAGNSVTINFLTMIDAEQRPIRQIAIDWGAGAPPQIAHLSNSDGTGLAPKTLDSDPFIFTSSPYQIPGIYTVKVMVQDNWYWCNGAIDKAGCYKNNICNGSPNGCDNTANWLPFPGKIIVK